MYSIWGWLRSYISNTSNTDFLIPIYFLDIVLLVHPNFVAPSSSRERL